jgi:hypothetical protein
VGAEIQWTSSIRQIPAKTARLIGRSGLNCLATLFPIEHAERLNLLYCCAMILGLPSASSEIPSISPPAASGLFLPLSSLLLLPFGLHFNITTKTQSVFEWKSPLPHPLPPSYPFPLPPKQVAKAGLSNPAHGSASTSTPPPSLVTPRGAACRSLALTLTSHLHRQR